LPIGEIVVNNAGMQRPVPAPLANPEPGEPVGRPDPLYIRSVEKAFRVLAAFGAATPTLSLAQVAAATEMDKSAAQRFVHTLERLGYLGREPNSSRLSLTPRTLELGTHYIRASALVQRAMPFLLELSRSTQESVSLTVLDDTDVVYVVRFTSRHMVSSNVVIGTRLPAYCTAPGRAMLARLPAAEADALLARSDRRAVTPATTWELPALQARLKSAADAGYAMAVGEIFSGDISLASAVTGARGEPIGAVSLSISSLWLSPRKAETKFAPLVTMTAQALSLPVLPPAGARTVKGA
jgi:DNA-binding IclR family transcriptional regulator